MTTSPGASVSTAAPEGVWPLIRTDPLPSTSWGLSIARIVQVCELAFVSSRSAMRLPAAPSHRVIRAASFAGSHALGAGVAVGLGVAVRVGTAVAVEAAVAVGIGWGEGLALAVATGVAGAVGAPTW